jgi:protein-S-isoprenylcysteine O-methyltransferase Ste14
LGAWARFEAPTWLRLLAVGAVDTVLMLWMYRALGINVSPVEEAREIATLITTGPYRPPSSSCGVSRAKRRS